MKEQISSLEGEPCVKLNLTSGTDGGEYSSNVVREATRCITEDSVSVPSQAKRILRVARNSKIWMIEKIVGFRPEGNGGSVGQLKALLERRIKFRKRRAAEAIPSSGAELIGGWHRKRTRIEPTRRSTRSTTVWASTRVRIAN